MISGRFMHPAEVGIPVNSVGRGPLTLEEICGYRAQQARHLLDRAIQEKDMTEVAMIGMAALVDEADIEDFLAPDEVLTSRHLGITTRANVALEQVADAALAYLEAAEPSV